MNTRYFSLQLTKSRLVITWVILVSLVITGCGSRATVAVAAIDTLTPTPTDTEVPLTNTPVPTDTPTPEPTDTPEPTLTPTEEPTATPDRKATAAAEATSTAEVLIAKIDEELQTIDYSTDSGSFGWAQEGVEVISLDPYYPYIYSPFAEGLIASDFILSIEITWESTGGFAGCGFFFRSEANFEDGEQYEFQTIRLSGLPAWDIIVNKYGEFQRNITGVLTAGAINQEQGSMNKYLFIAEGGKFTLYVNDQRIGSYHDYSVTRADGRFAFTGWQESGETTCTFKNSWVWLLEPAE